MYVQLFTVVHIWIDFYIHIFLQNIEILFHFILFYANPLPFKRHVELQKENSI